MSEATKLILLALESTGFFLIKNVGLIIYDLKIKDLCICLLNNLVCSTQTNFSESTMKLS